MKKLVSIVLASVMLCLCAIPAFGAPKNVAEPDYMALEPDYPIILVRGMDFTGLTENYGTDAAEPAIKAFEFKGIATALLNFVVKGITTLSLDNAMSCVVDYVREILGKLACDKNGESEYDVTTVKYPENVSNYPSLYDFESGTNETAMVKTLADRYGAQNVYFYVYDWRLDPYMLADELNDMIELALSEHPSKNKVNLICASMGGQQTIVYMAKYGYSKLNKIMFMSAAFCGAYVPTDLFQGKVVISEETLYNFLEYSVKGDSLKSTLLSAASKLGVFKIAEILGKWFVGRYSQMAYDDLLLDTFGTMPGFWALVLEDEYDECMEYMFTGKQEEYAGVIEKAERLHEIAQSRDAMLNNAIADGVKITVVANYDIPLIPVYERACTSGDGTLETAPMSGFARVADYGKTLTDVTPGRYVSSDCVIDASDCLFPDYTWFVKGAKHVSCSSDTEYTDFMLWLLDFDGQPTIDSNEDYPQFLLSDTSEKIEILS